MTDSAKMSTVSWVFCPGRQEGQGTAGGRDDAEEVDAREVRVLLLCMLLRSNRAREFLTTTAQKAESPRAASVDALRQFVLGVSTGRKQVFGLRRRVASGRA